jgi:hypothetical protein
MTIETTLEEAILIEISTELHGTDDTLDYFADRYNVTEADLRADLECIDTVQCDDCGIWKAPDMERGDNRCPHCR